MGNRRLVLALVACAAAAPGCADDVGVCDGAAIEIREPLADPVVETEMTCTGNLTGLCARPVVRLDESRCESPQVELATADRDDLFVGLTLVVEDGAVTGVLAAASGTGNTWLVDRGWLQLYQGSLAEPDRLSGELSIWLEDGSGVIGRFTAQTNP